MLRGDGKVYILKTPDMKLRYDKATSLQNGKNKEFIFNLIDRPILEDKNKLNERVVFFSNKEHFLKITSDQVLQIPEKASDHKEADTKLVALVESVEVNGNSVMVRSPSGDIDTLVLFILHQFEGKNVFIDNGVRKNRKIIDMSTTMLSSQQRHALAGVHAFSGNDYISSFSRKGKKKMWNLVLKNERFLQVFSEFGLISNTTDDAISSLEEFLWCLYGDPKMKKVGKLRVKLFQTRFNGDGKNIDLISLPPCYSNMRLHIDRACYVAIMFHESRRLMMLLDDPVEHG